MLVHASRDRILLDGGNEYNEDGDNEEEVFALEGMSDDEDEYAYDEAVGYDGEEGDEDMEEEKEESSNKYPTSKSKSKAKAKSKSTSKTSKDTVTSPQPDSEEETWGRSKGAYYSSNAAQLDSDDEEANELEEQEALRLQAKGRDAMGDDDFGLGGVVEGEVEPAEATYAAPWLSHASVLAENLHVGTTRRHPSRSSKLSLKTSSQVSVFSRKDPQEPSHPRGTGTTRLLTSRQKAELRRTSPTTRTKTTTNLATLGTSTTTVNQITC